MKTIPFPEELRKLWHRIVDKANEIGGWAGGYSRGYIDADEREFPAEAPSEVPVFDDDAGPWMDWSHREMYASIREIGDTGAEVPPDMAGKEYPEFHFGTFGVFRIPNDVHAAMNADYEDTAGTENERFIGDGDYTVVVYML